MHVWQVLCQVGARTTHAKGIVAAPGKDERHALATELEAMMAELALLRERLDG
jgi:hypothetical protein